MQNSNKVIILFFPGALGGAEKIVAEGYRALVNEGANVELWIIGETRAPEALAQFKHLITKLSFKEFFCQSVFDWRLIKKLKNELKKTNSKIIHSHGFKASFYAYIAKSDEKLVITHHGKTAHTLKVRLYETIEEFLMKRANRVISVSQKMKQDLQVQSINSVLIENFLTIKTSAKTPNSDSTLKLLFVGRLSPEKGCHYLVEAMNGVNRNDIQLTIVGDGVDASSLKTMATSNKIKFLGFRNDISQLMSQHDVLIMPSLREGLPLTLIEAICQGLPIIASHVGGIPELVQHQVNGILVGPENISEIREAIIIMQENFASFKLRAEEAAPELLNRFSSRTWAKKTSDLYNELSQP